MNTKYIVYKDRLLRRGKAINSSSGHYFYSGGFGGTRQPFRLYESKPTGSIYIEEKTLSNDIGSKVGHGDKKEEEQCLKNEEEATKEQGKKESFGAVCCSTVEGRGASEHVSDRSNLQGKDDHSTKPVEPDQQGAAVLETNPDGEGDSTYDGDGDSTPDGDGDSTPDDSDAELEDALTHPILIQYSDLQNLQKEASKDSSSPSSEPPKKKRKTHNFSVVY